MVTLPDAPDTDEPRRGVTDRERERIRETKARADLLEFQRLRIAKEVTSIGEVKDFFGNILAGFRQQLLEAPTALSYRLNPSDPELAREVLHDFVVRVLDGLGRQMESFIPGNDAPAGDPPKPRVKAYTTLRTRRLGTRNLTTAPE